MNRAHGLICSSGWWAGTVEVVHGDATEMPFADARFSGVVCFTMLHHLPSTESQDRLLSEVSRVLRAGGVFACTDSLATGFVFRLLHVADTLVPVIPDELPERVRRAGLIEPRVEESGRSFRFRAYKPVRPGEAPPQIVSNVVA